MLVTITSNVHVMLRSYQRIEFITSCCLRKDTPPPTHSSPELSYQGGTWTRHERSVRKKPKLIMYSGFCFKGFFIF